MRIYKFRAWDKESKEMHYQENGCEGVEFYFGGGNNVRLLFYAPRLVDGECIDDYSCKELEDYEIMQFIGLKDKNGKEIYEGDIVETTMHYGDDYGNQVGDAERETIEIKWREDKKSQFVGFSLFPSDDIYKLKIIGNIHENPELLKTQC